MTLVDRVCEAIAKADYSSGFKKDIDLGLAKQLGCSYSLVSKLRSGNYNWRKYYTYKASPRALAKQRCLERNQELGRRTRR